MSRISSNFKPVPLHIQLKYTNILSGRLKLFKWIKKDKEAFFRCPFCGDSSSNRKKRSAYFYVNPTGVVFHCFRGCPTVPLSKFLERYDQGLSEDFKKDFFLENGFDKRWEEKKTKNIIKVVQTTTKFSKKSSLDKLERLDKLPDGHYAKEYVISRKIPEQHYDKLWFTENYKLWIHENVNAESFSDVPEKQMKSPDPRIVIPFFTKSGLPFAFQGRYLGKSEKATRYITIKDSQFPDDIPLVYGIDRVDLKKPVIIVEGPLDSLFIPNSVACAGTGLNKLLKLKDTDFIFCYDNQPRSKSVVKLVEKLIRDGKKLVIWNSELKAKDINDMVKSGELDIDKITDQLYNMTYSGFDALIQFDKWKKI